jgi:hypothetical protein
MLGELVQTTAGKWITHPPACCPNGRRLGPNHILVGDVACLGPSESKVTRTVRRPVILRLGGGPTAVVDPSNATATPRARAGCSNCGVCSNRGAGH